MHIRTACHMIGNGNRKQGHDIVIAIALRLKHARTEHPASEWESKGLPWAIGIVADEMREAEESMEAGDEAHCHDELLDVVATAVRAYNGEYRGGE